MTRTSPVVPLDRVGPVSWAARLVPTLHQRLDSGLEVIVIDRPGLRNAVCLSHLRGGSRVDPPGAAGAAHLAEHLLTQGLGSDDERWVTPIVALGGDLAATTHPDYLEFCFEGPHAALAQALRAERERLTRWPRLREGELAKQRDGVCREIEQHVLGRAARDLPWPALGERVFGSWAEGHDPFGEVAHVSRLTEARCREFSAREHRPDGTVTIVVADLRRLRGGADAVLDALDGVPPPQGEPPTMPTPVPAADADGVLDSPTWAAGHSVGALAWRVPSVIDAPQRYAGLLVVAAYLGVCTGGRARLGQMVAMDRRDADALTFTMVDPSDARPALERARQACRTLSAGSWDDAALRIAVRRARTEIAALIDQPRGSAQLLGRAGLLAGDPAEAGRWVECVREVGHQDVVDAALDLVAVPPVGLVGRPAGARGTRAPTRSKAMAADLEVGPGSDPAPVPTVGFARSTLSGSVLVAMGPDLEPARVARLRGRGFLLTRDSLGWSLEHRGCGNVDDLAAEVDVELGAGTSVRHLVAVGPRADAVAPWRRRPPATPEPPGELGGGRVEVRVADGLPKGAAHAQLRWPIAAEGFVERWLALALMADVQARGCGRDPSSCSSPPGISLTLRQEVLIAGNFLVADVWASPTDLPAALSHLAAELQRIRLGERARGLRDTAIALAGQWLRDEVDVSRLTRRVGRMLDLGATPDDVCGFDVRLLTTGPESVVDRLVCDTSSLPQITVRTERPDLLTPPALDLEWMRVSQHA